MLQGMVDSGQRKTRVPGFDVARCLAILAMVFVNYEVVLASGVSSPGWLKVLADAFEGRASALFVVLAGIGITMLDCRSVIWKRGLFLLVVGYSWHPLWGGDILHYYAFYLFIGGAALGLNARALLGLTLASVVGFVVLFKTLDYGAGWNWFTLEHMDFWTAGGQVRNLVFNGWHPLLPWLGFLFLGMALGRWGIVEAHHRRAAMGISLFGWGIAAWGASFFPGLLNLYGLSSIPPGPFYMLSAGSSAVFVITVCLEITSNDLVAKWTQPLAWCGQLALTFYVAHIFVGLFDEATFAENVPRNERLSVAFERAAFFGVGAILFASLWRQRFRHGPLESLLRRFSRFSLRTKV